jgi:30S ribosome assembly GTPase
VAIKKCSGCGAILQSSDEKEPGFIPESVMEDTTKSSRICKRCFRIKNYGSHEVVRITDADYVREVTKVVKESDVVIFMIDLIDFDGSFNEKLINIVKKKPIIAAVNKIDLVPDRKHPSEIANWVKKRFAEKGIKPIDIAIMSVATDYGVNGIIKKLNHFYKKGAMACIVGTTNVGKSSLINGMIGGKSQVTVSKYPGTTLKAIAVAHPDTNHIFIDTPGVIPEGRVSDMVCGECSVKLVPSKEISRKTFKLQKDRVLMFGGLVYMKAMDECEHLPIFQAFAAKDVTFHETNEERAKELMREKAGEFINPPCEKCKDEFYARTFIKKVFVIQEGEELSINGLGWISVRRGPLTIEANVPEGTGMVIRPALIAPKVDKS